MDTNKVMGIRREDKSVWERRSPMTPAAVEVLVQDHGVPVRVQPSPTRVFADDEYRQVGAEVDEDLAPCNAIFAVKEVPPALFLPGQAYVFFSHTIKGQAYNMTMLRRMVEQKCTLIDYERIVDDRGRRLVFFGRHAGLAGMIDTLWTLGQRLAALGIESPFAAIRPAHSYPSLAAAEREVGAVGERIRSEGLPDALAPFVCGFTGYGNVSQGAQQVFDLLPVDELAPAELAHFMAHRRQPTDRLFKVVFHEEHLVEPLEAGTSFSLNDYYQHPERYRGVFERYAPHLSLLVNGVFWTAKYPRLLTNEYLRALFAGSEKARLLAIGDISCDIEGSIECTVKATTQDDPVFVYDPATGVARDGFDGPGVAVMSIDNLPCELPREAAESFSAALLPYAAEIVRADYTKPFEELLLPAPIKRALVLLKGKFTPEYEYMESFLRKLS